VGLILSLSGKVTDSSLPSEALDSAWLYEITLKDQEPNREFLRLREDLARGRVRSSTPPAAAHKARLILVASSRMPATR
jgi:hypothetical protein